MARVTAEEYAEKWGRRLKASTEDVRRGIDRVDHAPGLQAARAQELMETRLMEAINSGMWAKQVAGVSLDEWKTAFLTKGVPRIAAGVDAAHNKQVDMAQDLLAAVDAASAKANALPKGTIEDSINRMSTFAREMHSRKLRKG